MTPEIQGTLDRKDLPGRMERLADLPDHRVPVPMTSLLPMDLWVLRPSGSRHWKEQMVRPVLRVPSVPRDQKEHRGPSDLLALPVLLATMVLLGLPGQREIPEIRGDRWDLPVR